MRLHSTKHASFPLLFWGVQVSDCLSSSTMCRGITMSCLAFPLLGGTILYLSLSSVLVWGTFGTGSLRLC